MSWWRTLSRVLRIGYARYIVGEDLQRNVYYELPAGPGSRLTRR